MFVCVCPCLWVFYSVKFREDWRFTGLSCIIPLFYYYHNMSGHLGVACCCWLCFYHSCYRFLRRSVCPFTCPGTRCGLMAHGIDSEDCKLSKRLKIVGSYPTCIMSWLKNSLGRFLIFITYDNVLFSAVYLQIKAFYYPYKIVWCFVLRLWALQAHWSCMREEKRGSA